MRNKFTKIIALLLLVIIGHLNYNQVVNLHAHLINGEVIYHSHPYKHDPADKSPYQSHQHSPLDLFLLEQISNPVATLFPFIICLIAPIHEIFKIIPRFLQNIPLKQYLFYKIYRAPPFTSLFDFI